MPDLSPVTTHKIKIWSRKDKRASGEPGALYLSMSIGSFVAAKYLQNPIPGLDVICLYFVRLCG